MGDESALSALYDRFAGRVYSLAARIIGDEAEAGEITLDVFMRAWRRASEFDRRRSTVATWLCVMARSRAIDALRARRSRRNAVLRAQAGTPSRPPAMGEGVGSGAKIAERSEARAHIDRALEALAAEQRHAIELAFFQGLTHTQIAEALDAPLGTVKTRIRSGMLKLRDLLAPLYSDEAP